MKTERLALLIVELAFKLAEGVAGWLERREKRVTKDIPRGLTWPDLLELKRHNDSVRRSQAPTVVIPPPSEWGKTTSVRGKPGGGGSRH